MKFTNTYFSAMRVAIQQCTYLHSCPAYQYTVMALANHLCFVDELHELGMHRIAHKLDDAICNVVERNGVCR
ncbi:hypothetical protein [Pseudoalteromonas piscicida]|uniref:hypothetical protein n=1 Tax=Pseudoalteromonas piscicida TaxID=43662 RepID=UPI0030A364F0